MAHDKKKIPFLLKPAQTEVFCPLHPRSPVKGTVVLGSAVSSLSTKLYPDTPVRPRLPEKIPKFSVAFSHKTIG